MTRFSDAIVLALATVAFGAAGQMAQAQASAIPAEFPPASFDANQYVDSQGCAFIRAGISGAVTWVPRMSRGREQLCGFQPTFATAPPPEPAPMPSPTDPVIALSLDPDPEPAPATVPAAPVVAAAPAPRPAAPVIRAPRVAIGAPTTTVASVVTPPTIGLRTPTGPAPAAAPTAAPVSAAVAAPRPISQAVACAGLTGIQPNLINARTGDPINCGPGPRVAAATTPAVPVPAAPTPLRLTLAEICARSAATGQTFINQATGQPVACPRTAPAPVIAAATPMAPTGPVRPAVPAAPSIAAAPVALAGQAATACPGVTYVGGTDRYPLRCGPQALSPSSTVSGLAAEPRVMARAPVAGLGVAPVPASNPVGATAVSAAPVPGYRPVWDDGRVNPNRGVPAALSGAVVAQPVARVSTRAVPQAVAPAPQGNGHRYVQVGTYGDPSNAQRAVARLQSMGLPAGTAAVSRNGQALQIVVAGPFGDAGSLQSALRAARASGYGDAFTRR